MPELNRKKHSRLYEYDFNTAFNPCTFSHFAESLYSSAASADHSASKSSASFLVTELVLHPKPEFPILVPSSFK